MQIDRNAGCVLALPVIGTDLDSFAFGNLQRTKSGGGRKTLVMQQRLRLGQLK